jgi:hypothetical protein
MRQGLPDCWRTNYFTLKIFPVRQVVIGPKFECARFLALLWAIGPEPQEPADTGDPQAEHALGRLREQLKSFGRDDTKFGIEAWLRIDAPDPQRWAAAADGWYRLGADMVMLYPMYRIASLDEHIETLRRFKEVAAR